MSVIVEGDVRERLRAAIRHAATHHRSADLELAALEEIKRLEREVDSIQLTVNNLRAGIARRPVQPEHLDGKIADIIEAGMNPNCSFCDGDPKSITAKIMELLAA